MGRGILCPIQKGNIMDNMTSKIFATLKKYKTKHVLRKPVKIVFELNTERDDIELLGRVEIVAILKGGKLLDSEDETWNLKDVYPLSDVEKIIDKV